MKAGQADKAAARRAVIYCRVSTQEQADSGLGLQAQLSRCRGYCEAQGWTVAGVFSDAGVSAKTLDRPELERALEALPRGGVLVTLKLDRLTRTVADLAPLAERIAASAADWVAVQEHYDTSTATGRLMLRMVLELSQWEREVIGERTTAALAVKRERRERLGTTPLGYRTAGDGSVSLDRAEMETVRLARALRFAGKSYREIAATLAAKGRRTKRGGRWHAETVRLIVAPRYLDAVTARESSEPRSAAAQLERGRARMEYDTRRTFASC
jgi:DNA invertase Pin-like site-specific DNA recombinase